MAIVNIQGKGQMQIGHASSDPHATTTKAKGAWRGQSLALAQAGMAQQVMQPQDVAAQGLPAIPSRNVLDRVVTVAAYRAKTPDDILARAHGIEPRDIRNGAKAILNRQQAIAVGRRRDSMKGYLQLRFAASMLEDDVKDDDVAAKLTHQGHQARNAEDLAKHVATLLDGSAEHEQELEHFLQDVLSGLDTTADDAGKDRIQDLKDDLWEARKDEKRLMDVLRKAQGIPSLDRSKGQEERKKMRQALQDEIERFESENPAGAQVLAAYNAAKVAATTPDPLTFVDTYAELVTKPHSLPQAMQVLVRKYEHNLDQLLDFVTKFQQARADDLNATPPSSDKIRTRSAVEDLGTTFVFSTLIGDAQELSGYMFRTGHAGAR